MILIQHDINKVLKITLNSNEQLEFNEADSIALVLKKIAQKFPLNLIIWCNVSIYEHVNLDVIPKLFHHKKMMMSYNPSSTNFISNAIGYIEQTPYTNINKDVQFPTWLMSSLVGVIHASVINQLSNKIKFDNNFDYFLNSLSKIAMPKGLFCYSEPQLLKINEERKIIVKSSSTKQLFCFVKEHYKLVWSLNLLLCFVVFDKKFPLFSFLSTIFIKRNKAKINLDNITFERSDKLIIKKEIDVVIPTIGRKKHLFDVLLNLKSQTILPKRVIIVEQNSDKSTISELDYIQEKKWPFQIKHFFIHKTGACNARNLAIKEVKSEWCFFADDDIYLENNFIAKSFDKIEELGVEVINLLCLQPHEKQSYFNTSQTDIFGSGTSIVKSSILDNTRFDTSFEFGFGEDSDFGMQIRNLGKDIIYVPDIKITHLKAPIGGFRTPIVHPWDKENVKPKPSPMMMVFIKKHYNKYQMNGSKYVLFIKYYRRQKIKNPINYIKSMNASWEQSLYWSDQLILKNKVH